MKVVGLIALTAALLLLALPAWAGSPDPCQGSPDTDSDTICDAQDNCLLIPNHSQCDTDGDGYGNACDGDFDQDAAVSPNDFLAHFVPDFISGTDSGTGTDMDCDGAVTPNDFLAHFVPQFIKGAPGP
jgi:hypothetical protein